MDTSLAAAECGATLMAAAGYVVHTFPTGQGNVIWTIVPVIKISGNPMTTMGEHIDVDVTGILRREQTLAAEPPSTLTIRTANGRLTAAEALGHPANSLTKLNRSA